MIFGTGHIIFEYDSVEYELEETQILSDEPITKELVNESDIANIAKYYQFDDRWQVQVLYNIYKNESFITQFKTIYALKNNNVYLKRFSDGNYFKDSNGDRVLFNMTMKPAYYESKSKHDYLLITFRSLTAVDLVQTALDDNTIFNEKGSDLFPLTDEDGNLILSE